MECKECGLTRLEIRIHYKYMIQLTSEPHVVKRYEVISGRVQVSVACCWISRKTLRQDSAPLSEMRSTAQNVCSMHPHLCPGYQLVKPQGQITGHTELSTREFRNSELTELLVWSQLHSDMRGNFSTLKMPWKCFAFWHKTNPFLYCLPREGFSLSNLGKLVIFHFQIFITDDGQLEMGREEG